MLGHGGELLSYALQNRIFAAGHEAATVAAGASLNPVTINVAGIVKATDIVLVTLDLNGGAGGDVTSGQAAYVYNIVDNTSITIAASVDNANASDQTIFLNWVVLR